MLNKYETGLSPNIYPYGSFLEDVFPLSFYSQENTRKITKISIQTNLTYTKEYQKKWDTRYNKTSEKGSKFYHEVQKEPSAYKEYEVAINQALKPSVVNLIHGILIQYKMNKEPDTFVIDLDLMSEVMNENNASKKSRRQIIRGLINELMTLRITLRLTDKIERIFFDRMITKENHYSFTISRELKKYLRVGNSTNKVLISTSTGVQQKISDFLQKYVQVRVSRTNNEYQDHPYEFRYVSINRDRLLKYLGLEYNGVSIKRIHRAFVGLKKTADRLDWVFPTYELRGDMFVIINNGYIKKEVLKDLCYKEGTRYIIPKEYKINKKYIDWNLNNNKKIKISRFE